MIVIHTVVDHEEIILIHLLLVEDVHLDQFLQEEEILDHQFQDQDHL